MKHIKSVGTGAAIGSMSVVVMSALTGCSQAQEDTINQNKFVIVEELSNGKFAVLEETPVNGPTRIMVKSKDGTMRQLSDEEMKTLAQQEYDRVQKGTSETTQNHGSEGMGLGGTILAVAAGSILGNMIGNALMGNKSFAQSNRAATQRARNINRSRGGSSGKKGFFGKNSKSSSRSRGFFGG